MKKIISLVFFLTALIFAQAGNNGNVKLIFNNESIDLPVKSVSLVKGNGLLLNIKAENNNSDVQQKITFQFGLKELSANNSEVLEGTQIYISNRNNKSGTGNDLSIIFNNSSGKKEENSDRVDYSFYKKGEKVSWEINSVKMKIGITTVKYENGKLYIEGNCTGEFSSTSAPKGQKTEIKDCKFEVII